MLGMSRPGADLTTFEIRSNMVCGLRVILLDDDEADMSPPQDKSFEPVGLIRVVPCAHEAELEGLLAIRCTS
jgi:hypothetical protein